MSDYISREAVKVALKFVEGNLVSDSDWLKGYKTGLFAAIEAIDEAPAADVRPVVLCKDCKHWEKGDFQGGNCIEHLEWGGSCEYGRFVRFESEFCSYGERRIE